MAFSQLTFSQRQKIQQLHRKGSSQAAIAREIGVHRSTVKRELDRNSKEGNYLAEDAHAVTLYRKRMAGTISQLMKYKKPAGFSEKLQIAFQRKKDFPESVKDKKPGRLLKSCTISRRTKYRERDFEKYSRPADNRSYKLHANKRRDWFYSKWKNSYERECRFRDDQLAELNRSPRSADDRWPYRSRNVQPYSISRYKNAKRYYFSGMERQSKTVPGFGGKRGAYIKHYRSHLFGDFLEYRAYLQRNRRKSRNWSFYSVSMAYVYFRIRERRRKRKLMRAFYEERVRRIDRYLSDLDQQLLELKFKHLREPQKEEPEKEQTLKPFFFFVWNEWDYENNFKIISPRLIRIRGIP
jgi:hypothetical protein